MKALTLGLIRRHPVGTAIVWTAVVLFLLAAYFVTPTYLSAIFRHI